jgi:folate-binding protein YgfZ
MAITTTDTATDPGAPPAIGWGDVLRDTGAVLDASPAPDAPLRVLHFGNPYREFAAADADAVCCPLIDWTAVAIRGADAAAFLQGQLTNDISLLEVGDVQWNAWCSAKGRLLANFPLTRTEGEGFQILLPGDIAPAIVRRLRMYVLRAKVAVVPQDDDLCIGLHRFAQRMPEPGQMQHADGSTLVGLSDGRVIAIVPRNGAGPAWSDYSARAKPVGGAAWDWLAIRAGIPVITAATQDRFVPQMLFWELHGVSFRKGCYPGQEIVARMQYRGRPKERLFRARWSGAAPVPGAPLYAQTFGSQACGTVVNATDVPGQGAELLLVAQAAAAVDGIHLNAARDGAPLEILPLPYPVPDPAATRGS